MQISSKIRRKLLKIAKSSSSSSSHPTNASLKQAPKKKNKTIPCLLLLTVDIYPKP